MPKHGEDPCQQESFGPHSSYFILLKSSLSSPAKGEPIGDAIEVRFW